MIKFLAAALAVVVAIAVGLAYQWDRTRAALAVETARAEALTEAVKRAVEREKRDRKVLVARQAKIASETRKSEQAQEALSEALQRNKPWSDTDVPDDVQKALGGPSSGLGDGL
jgi:hypothetical protein